MKVSKHNYIPDIKSHSGLHCDDYLIFKGFGLTVLLCKIVETVKFDLKF
jgi:hypothetical protein